MQSHIEVCLRWVPSGQTVVIGCTPTLHGSGSSSAFLVELATLLGSLAGEYSRAALSAEQNAATAAPGEPTSDM